MKKFFTINMVGLLLTTGLAYEVHAESDTRQALTSSAVHSSKLLDFSDDHIVDLYEEEDFYEALDEHQKFFKPGFRGRWIISRNSTITNTLPYEEIANRIAEYYSSTLPALGSYEDLFISSRHYSNFSKKSGDTAYFIDHQFSYTYLHTYEQEQELNAFIKHLASTVPQNATDFEKILFVNDYILKYNIANTSSSSATHNSPYSIIANKDAYSLGYALFAHKWFENLGMEVRTVKGQDLLSNMPAYWNLVKVDGKWYNFNVAANFSKRYDAQFGYDGFTYSHLLLSDQKQSPFYQRSEEYKTLEKATDTTYDFLGDTNLGASDGVNLYVTDRNDNVTVYDIATLKKKPEYLKFSRMDKAFGHDGRVFEMSRFGISVWDRVSEEKFTLHDGYIYEYSFSGDILTYKVLDDDKFVIKTLNLSKQSMDELLSRDYTAAQQKALHFDEEAAAVQPFTPHFEEKINALYERYNALSELERSLTKKGQDIQQYYWLLQETSVTDKYADAAAWQNTLAVPFKKSDPMYQWKITFNQAIHKEWHLPAAIQVYDVYGREVDITVESTDRKTVTLSPSSPYVKSYPYYIVIPQELQSARSQTLSKSVIASFIIE